MLSEGQVDGFFSTRGMHLRVAALQSTGANSRLKVVTLSTRRYTWRKRRTERRLYSGFRNHRIISKHGIKSLTQSRSPSLLSQLQCRSSKFLWRKRKILCPVESWWYSQEPRKQDGCGWEEWLYSLFPVNHRRLWVCVCGRGQNFTLFCETAWVAVWKDGFCWLHVSQRK